MIQRKIEQLSEADRRLLSAASVQGYEFDTAIVAKLVDADPADIEERLESLEHIYAFVRRSREYELPNGALSVRYRFVHVLYQNALYASLTPSRRVSLSTRAAESLLDAYGPASSEIAVDLAQLFESARDANRAVEYLAIAADASLRFLANQEAALLARRGLKLVAHQPESDARFEREMNLLTTLGVALGAMQGIASPEVGKVHARAYDLWKRLGARPRLFSIAFAQWTYRIISGQLDVSLRIGDELLQMAEATGDRAMAVAANNCLGSTLHHMGEHRRAAARFDRGLEAYSTDLRTSFVGMPIDPAVLFISESSRALWVLGYPDQAVRRLHRATELAAASGHPESIAFAALFGAYLYHFLQDVHKTLEYSDTVLAVSKDRDIATTLAWGLTLHGWALGTIGRVDEGITELRGSLAGQRAAGSEIARPQFAWMLGDVCLRAGKYEEAAAAITDGLDTAARTGDHYWDAELFRLKGAIAVQSRGALVDAERHFLAALDEAKARDAKSFELRAATSLARLWHAQGRHRDAEQLLRPIYEWFTEGLDTADLIAARRLLD